MIYKAIIRAYPISDIVVILTSQVLKQATQQLIETMNADDPDIQKLLSEKYTIEYLKEHYYREVSGSKPLSLMAAKHKDLILNYLKSLLQIHSTSTYNRHVRYQDFVTIFIDALEKLQQDKETTTAAPESP